jgi:hypothetical protein
MNRQHDSGSDSCRGPKEAASEDACQCHRARGENRGERPKNRLILAEDVPLAKGKVVQDLVVQSDALPS